MNLRTVKYGPLKCRVLDGAGPIQRLVVLCHGFGAGGDDLVPLAGELLDYDPAGTVGVRFVFPEAPLELDDLGLLGGRAWWMIDMAKLQQAAALGEYRDLRREVPTRLPEARQELEEAISAALTDARLPRRQLVVGGFSQGAMLATDHVLYAQESPGALVVWSGTLLCEDDWSPRFDRVRGLTIVHSHGRSDPILPFSLALELRERFVSHGANVQIVDFPGGHTIPTSAVLALLAVLKTSDA